MINYENKSFTIFGFLVNPNQELLKIFEENYKSFLI